MAENLKKKKTTTKELMSSIEFFDVFKRKKKQDTVRFELSQQCGREKKSKRKWICLQKRCTTSTGTDRFLLYSLLLGEKMVYYGFFFVCVLRKQ